VSHPTITKPALADPPPNLGDYAEARRTFSWQQARDRLDGLPGGAGLNIAHEAVDRHAGGPDADRVALRWLGKRGEVRELSYAQLREQTNRFANLLVDLGAQPGDRVFALSSRVPELYVGALGALKAGAVFCPLFPAFGPEPIAQRMNLGSGRFLITTEALMRRKVSPLLPQLAHLDHVLVVGEVTDPEPVPGVRVHSLDAALAGRSDRFAIPPTDPETPALLHFTSGTTGTPKGAVHVHDAVVVHHETGRSVLDLHPGDRYWCTADPGWVTGTSYGIVAPLTAGVTMVIDEAEFDVERWYRVLEQERVQVWYTAPTAIRMLMRAGAAVAREHDLSALRHVVSVGEPLNPEAVVWGQQALGLPIHDSWWQTETGGIMIANFRSEPIEPGSMGWPVPGIEAAVLRRGPDDALVVDGGGLPVLAGPGETGELALRRGWPSMFRAYLDQPERYARAFAGDWYLSGDLAQVDAEGRFWFVGRGDDVIKSAGHLIGPFEVESALVEHPAVAEAGVIGVPDDTMGQRVKAFVSLVAGSEPSEELRLELVGFARSRLGPAVAPREIEFSDGLPKTRSGKIMRRLLKARELGLPEGDLSTLETGRSDDDTAPASAGTPADTGGRR
jgi:acetyl-CoA synthetase